MAGLTCHSSGEQHPGGHDIVRFKDGLEDCILYVSEVRFYLLRHHLYPYTTRKSRICHRLRTYRQYAIRHGSSNILPIPPHYLSTNHNAITLSPSSHPPYCLPPLFRHLLHNVFLCHLSTQAQNPHDTRLHPKRTPLPRKNPRPGEEPRQSLPLGPKTRFPTLLPRRSQTRVSNRASQAICKRYPRLRC